MINILSKEFLEQEYLIKQKSIPQIAREVKRNKNTIIYWLKKFNIPMRNLSQALSLTFKGNRSHFWKGGIKRHKEGYILVYSPNHPFKNCQEYVRQHRLIV